MENETLLQLLKEQQSINKQMAAFMGKSQGLHVKAPAGAGTYTELHGDGSLFGARSVERDVISAHIRPLGLANRLPIFPTVTERPYFASLTGYTATSGSEQATPCADAPAGFVKGCNLTASFGRVARDTQTIEINKVMLQKNRGDFTDLMLRGQVLGGIGSPLTPDGLTDDQILNVVTKSEMVIAGVNMERKLGQMLWNGTPTANNAGGGYKEFPGLDNQITTGHVDAETQVACPALDSDVKNFNFNAVDGTTLDIVEYLSMIEFYLRYNARQMGLEPVSWVIAMTPSLWFELSAVWPCSYLTHRCGNGAGANPIVINDNVNINMRDTMRTGSYIDINGNRYPVIVDDGIPEDTNVTNGNLAAGEYASDIYFIPVSITGNFPVLYYEHVDYRRAASDIALLRGNETFWTDDGRFFWALEQVKFCYKLTMLTEPRVILRTPQLAGRLQNVKYSPLQHLRSSDPASAYFFDGGVSLRGNDAWGQVWGSSTS